MPSPTRPGCLAFYVFFVIDYSTFFLSETGYAFRSLSLPPHVSWIIAGIVFLAPFFYLLLLFLGVGGTIGSGAEALSGLWFLATYFFLGERVLRWNAERRHCHGDGFVPYGLVAGLLQAMLTGTVGG